jgi:ribosomal protein S18 acetylase RimI-like enzyme
MYKIVVDHAPSQSDNDVVREGLVKCYEAEFGERDKPLSIFLKSDSGEIFGGIQAFMDTESIYIDALWVQENLRNQGYGAKLLDAAEREAIENGCIFSLVDTWDFQAEGFYLKNGYERIGEIKNYWHGHSKLFFRKKLNASDFHFSHVKSSQIALIHEWLQQEHIKEWIHGTGLQNTLTDLGKFFQGESYATYWIGFHKRTPFAFLITAHNGPDEITLDLFICDLNYLGKGLAEPMIREFLKSHFSHMKKILIDPEAANRRAIHVYQKVGFKIIGEFIASWHPVPHYQMELHMQDFLNLKKEA